MTTYVYLLWRHDEHGPVDTVATLDRSAIVPIVHAKFDEANWQVVENLLSRPDADLAANDSDSGSDGHKLSDGWGGVHLQVCPLEGS